LRIHKIAKSGFYLRHVSPPIRPHGTTRLPLDSFSWNSILEDFFEPTKRTKEHWTTKEEKARPT